MLQARKNHASVYQSSNRTMTPFLSTPRLCILGNLYSHFLLTISYKTNNKKSIHNLGTHMKKHAAARAGSFNCFNGKGTYASTSFKSISYFHAHCLTVDAIAHSKKKANFSSMLTLWRQLYSWPQNNSRSKWMIMVDEAQSRRSIGCIVHTSQNYLS